VKKVDDSVQKTAKWHNEMLQKQANMPMTSDPVVTVAEIKASQKVGRLLI